MRTRWRTSAPSTTGHTPNLSIPDAQADVRAWCPCSATVSPRADRRRRPGRRPHPRSTNRRGSAPAPCAGSRPGRLRPRLLLGHVPGLRQEGRHLLRRVLPVRRERRPARARAAGNSCCAAIGTDDRLHRCVLPAVGDGHHPRPRRLARVTPVRRMSPAPDPARPRPNRGATATSSPSDSTPEPRAAATARPAARHRPPDRTTARNHDLDSARPAARPSPRTVPDRGGCRLRPPTPDPHPTSPDPAAPAATATARASRCWPSSAR